MSLVIAPAAPALVVTGSPEAEEPYWEFFAGKV